MPFVGFLAFPPQLCDGEGGEKTIQTSSRTIILKKPPQTQAHAIRAGISDLLVIAQLGSEDKHMHRGRARNRSCWEKAELSGPSERSKP